MRTALLSCPALLATLAAQDPAGAVEVPATDAPLQVAITSEQAGPVMHGTLGSDFTTAYFFRGIPQEDQGAIAEPYLDLSMPLFVGDGEIRSIDLTLGQWNSLHDGPTGTAGPQSMWYENDLYFGVTIQGDSRWSIGATYTTYYSPNGLFGTVQEVASMLHYDDGGLLGEGFAGLQPTLLVAFETNGQADAIGPVGVYAELSISPELPLGAVGDLELTLALPAKLGFSLADYYQSPVTQEDSAFGYFDLGVELSTPLRFLPARLGPWDGSFGVHALFLGDSNQERNHDDAFEVVLTCGLSTSF